MDAYDEIEAQISAYAIGSRELSAAQIAWFLETVWRVEPEIVADAICDGTGDKGIDGIVIDEDLSEITVVQSKHMNSKTKTQGDADLKHFYGVAPYFASPEGVDQLLDSGPNAELRMLIERLDIRALLEQNEYRVRLVFLTNGPADASATDYVKTLEGNDPPFEFWDQAWLAAVAGRTAHPGLLGGTYALDATSDVITTQLDANTSMALALVPATELVQRLPGIADRTVFDLNVRLSLGGTRINRELGKTVRDTAEHGLFAAYHNGLTLLTHAMRITGTRFELDGVSVVNGCQSLVALFDNQTKLTPELRVLVKIVQVSGDHSLESVITYRSNNQNPVNIRDQRSTHKFQLDLQGHVAQDYPGKMFYAIREGEVPTAPDVLDNRVAAQLLTAVWLKEPWAAVRKVRLFDAEYHRVFARYVDAHKLRLAYVLDRLISQRRTALAPELQASFASVRFTIAFLVAQVLRQSAFGAQLFDQPDRWLPELEGQLIDELGPVVDQVIDSVNVYIEGRKEAATDAAPFDPKVVFKSATGVRDLEFQVIQSHKLLNRQVERLGGTPGLNIAPLR